MNPGATSKETILQVCRDLVTRKGIAAVNMRTVVSDCGIALGTLYNYFSDKDALILATVESIWKDIFHTDWKCDVTTSFTDYILFIFERVKKSAEAYPNFLTAHSMVIAQVKKEEAKNTMEYYLNHMKMAMTNVLRKDSNVKPNVFSDSFTESDFIDFVLDAILWLLMKQEENCQFLVELVSRSIY